MLLYSTSQTKEPLEGLLETKDVSSDFTMISVLFTAEGFLLHQTGLTEQAYSGPAITTVHHFERQCQLALACSTSQGRIKRNKSARIESSNGRLRRDKEPCLLFFLLQEHSEQSNNRAASGMSWRSSQTNMLHSFTQTNPCMAA